ncbi:hypothetical protein PESHB4_08340 [Pediococcus ethanolidurans]
MTYKDIYGYVHENSKIVTTINEFKRVFIIEDADHRRFECLKKNPPSVHKFNVHWHKSHSNKVPSSYWDSFRTK